MAVYNDPPLETWQVLETVHNATQRNHAVLTSYMNLRLYDVSVRWQTFDGANAECEPWYLVVARDGESYDSINMGSGARGYDRPTQVVCNGIAQLHNLGPAACGHACCNAVVDLREGDILYLCLRSTANVTVDVYYQVQWRAVAV